MSEVMSCALMCGHRGANISFQAELMEFAFIRERLVDSFCYYVTYVC